MEEIAAQYSAEMQRLQPEGLPPGRYSFGGIIAPRWLDTVEQGKTVGLLAIFTPARVTQSSCPFAQERHHWSVSTSRTFEKLSYLRERL